MKSKFISLTINIILGLATACFGLTFSIDNAMAANSKPIKPANVANKPVNKLVANFTPNNKIDESWIELIALLKADTKNNVAIESFFLGLPPYGYEPMGAKIKELYKNATRKKTPSSKPTEPSKARIFKALVTEESLERCRVYLETYKTAFKSMEQKYGIPKEIIASLLYVETKHGTFLGSAKAMWSLASMASSTTIESVLPVIQELKIPSSFTKWLDQKLQEKSTWAYKELKALLVYCHKNNLDPQSMDGSVYGAVGICQFMPSNLSVYGADGNNDGIINVFEHEDAIHSAANYLSKHGWKKDGSVDEQRKTIKRYNNLTTYANTIITLAESLQKNQLQPMPSDALAEKK